MPTLPLPPPTPPSPDPQHAHDLDDVFGSSPSSPSLLPQHFTGRGNEEISDIPRLREKHETEGYRDGVTTGKARTVQGGFDEGYSLGAVLGLRVGRVLGVLEGVVRGMGGLGAEEAQEVVGAEEWKEEKERLEGLWKEARKELSTEEVFGREWWGEDGVWKFDVKGKGEGEGEGGGEEMDVVFSDVADAHPLIRKWERVVGEVVESWGVDLGTMEREGEGELVGEDGDGVVGKKLQDEKVEVEKSVKLGEKKELSW